jgi:division protein 1
VTEIDNKLEDLEEEAPKTPVQAATPKSSAANDDSVISEDPAMDASFMSESIYQKLPSHSPRSLKQRSISTVYQSSFLPSITNNG